MKSKRKKSLIGWTNVNWDLCEQQYEKENYDIRRLVYPMIYTSKPDKKNEKIYTQKVRITLEEL